MNVVKSLLLAAALCLILGIVVGAAENDYWQKRYGPSAKVVGGGRDYVIVRHGVLETKFVFDKPSLPSIVGGLAGGVVGSIVGGPYGGYAGSVIGGLIGDALSSVRPRGVWSWQYRASGGPRTRMLRARDW